MGLNETKISAAMKKADWQPAPPQDRSSRAKALKSSPSDRPGDIDWPADGLKIGIAGKNIMFTDRSFETNMTDPSNPGLAFSTETGGELRSGGARQIRTDIPVDDFVFGEQTINPRLKFEPTNIVNHFPPILTRPPLWLRTVMLVVKTIQEVKEELEE